MERTLHGDVPHPGPEDTAISVVFPVWVCQGTQIPQKQAEGKDRGPSFVLRPLRGVGTD